MKKTKTIFLLVLFSIVMLTFTQASAATITTAGSGNWNSTTNNAPWPGGVVPAATDNVIIAAGHTVTLVQNQYCGDITITGILRLNNTNILYVQGGGTSPVTTGAVAGNGTLRQVNTGGGCDVKLYGNWSFNGTITNVVNVAFQGPSDATVSAISANSFKNIYFEKDAGTTLFLNVTPVHTNTFAVNSGNICYNNAGAQTVKPATYPANLTLAGGGLKTMTSVTVNGILSMEGTATASAAAYGAAATLQYNTATARTAGAEWITPFAATGGVIIRNTGTITLNNAKVFNASVPLNINSGATLSTSVNNYALTFNGNFINDGTINAGSSAITITGTATQSIGAFTTTGAITFSKTSGTATLTGNVNAASLSFSANLGNTLQVSSGVTLTLTGSVTLNSSTSSNTACTLQGLGSINCGSIVVGTDGSFGSGTVTSTMVSTITNLSVTGNLTIASFIGILSSRICNSIFNLQSGSVNLDGVLTTTNENAANASTFSMASGTQTGTLLLSNASPFNLTGTGTNTITLAGTSTIVNYDRAGAQTVRGTSYTNLTLSGSGAKTTTGVTVTGILSMEGDATVSVSAAPSYGGSATLQYKGSAAKTVGLEWPSTFSATGGVIINNSNGVTLNAPKTVTNGCTIANGASIVETDANYVIGTTTSVQTVGTGASTLGGIGVQLNVGGADNLGNVTVTRISGTAPSGSGAKLKRSWAITSDNVPTGGRNITFSWASADDNGINKSNAIVFKSTDGGTSWTNIGTGQDASLRSIVAAGVTSFSLWTVGDGDNPLPVELSSFSAAVNNNVVVLSWVTKTEKNNYGFEVEKRQTSNVKSETGWSKIGFVQGSGTSNSTKNYTFKDKANNGTYSYRLKQIDTDGTYVYSNQVSVEVSVIPTKYDVANYPNPFNPATIIQFELPQATHINLTVYNLIGEKVITLVDEVMDAGVYQRTFSSNSYTGQLSSGIYFYRLATDNGINITKKMILAK